MDADITYEYAQLVSYPRYESHVVIHSVYVQDLDGTDFNLTCQIDRDGPIYEGDKDFIIDCEAPGAPSDAVWTWTTRGLTTNTNRLSATDISNPTFDVPDVGFIPDNTYFHNFYYIVRVSDDSHSEELEIDIRILKKNVIIISCVPYQWFYEGAPNKTVGNCTISQNNQPIDTGVYTWLWRAEPPTPNTDKLTATNIPNPEFDVPTSVSSNERYKYQIDTNFRGGTTFNVTIDVLNYDYEITVQCNDSPYIKWEGDLDFRFNCLVSGPPEGTIYSYQWYPVAPITTTLSRIRGERLPNPEFIVPENVDSDTIFMYRVVARADNSKEGSATVMVTIKDRDAAPPDPKITCLDDQVDEGSPNFVLACSVIDEPANATYVWTGDDISNRLANTDLVEPTFLVPDSVRSTTTYDYTVELQVGGQTKATEDVQITVKDIECPSDTIDCTLPPVPQITCTNKTVNEGSADFLMECSAQDGPVDNTYTYRWTGDDIANRLSDTGSLRPTFRVPSQLLTTTTYNYNVELLDQSNVLDSEDVRITVVDTECPSNNLNCVEPPVIIPELTCEDIQVYEGSLDIQMQCSVNDEPNNPSYEWEGDIQQLTATNVLNPFFIVPVNIDEPNGGNKEYNYTITLSAGDIQPITEDVKVTVLERGNINVMCNSPINVQEGSEDFNMPCIAAGGVGSLIYDWNPTDRLDDPTALAPLFDVPDMVDQNETHRYMLVASAENSNPDSAEVIINVLRNPDVNVVCTADPTTAYEGDPAIPILCEASNALGAYNENIQVQATPSDGEALLEKLSFDPSGEFSYRFNTPDSVNADMVYEYQFIVSAEDSYDGTSNVIEITVLDKKPLDLVCDIDEYTVYEGDEDIQNLGECVVPNGSQVDYVWSPDTNLSDPYVVGPTFYVPENVEADTTYEYSLSVNAINFIGSLANVSVNVLNREEVIEPPVVPEDTTKVAPPDTMIVLPTAPERVPAERPLELLVNTASVDFGVQYKGSRVALDVMTGQIFGSSEASYSVGRLTIMKVEETPDSVSVNMAPKVVLKNRDNRGAENLVFVPEWTYSPVCNVISSQSLASFSFGLLTLSEKCSIFSFGGRIQLLEAETGRYSGTIAVSLESPRGEETHFIDVHLTVIDKDEIQIGPEGVSFNPPETSISTGLVDRQALNISPSSVFLTSDDPTGTIRLYNPSELPLEITVQSDNGVSVYPGVMVLLGGQTEYVRFGVDPITFNETGFILNITSYPYRYVNQNQLPEENEKSATATFSVRGIYSNN